MDDREEALVMTGVEAIKYVADHFGVPSKYALAKALSGDGLTVQPIQITNYLAGTRMSKKVADRFYEVYDVTISDVYIQADWAAPKDGSNV